MNQLSLFIVVAGCLGLAITTAVDASNCSTEVAQFPFFNAYERVVDPTYLDRISKAYRQLLNQAEPETLTDVALDTMLADNSYFTLPINSSSDLVLQDGLHLLRQHIGGRRQLKDIESRLRTELRGLLHDRDTETVVRERIIDKNSNPKIKTVIEAQEVGFNIAFSPNESLAVVDRGYSLDLVDPVHGVLRTMTSNIKDIVNPQTHFSPSGHFLIQRIGGDSEHEVWNAIYDLSGPLFVLKKTSVDLAAWTHAGQEDWIVVTHTEVQHREGRTGKLIKRSRINTSTPHFIGVQIDPTGRFAILHTFASRETEGIILWDLVHWRIDREMSTPYLEQVNFSNTGKYLSVVSDNLGTIFETQSGNAVLSLNDRHHIAFSPDDTMVFSSNELWYKQKRAPFEVREIRSGKKLISGFHTPHSGWHPRTLYSPDGESIIVALTPTDVRLYNMAAGKRIKIPSFGNTEFQTALWSSDGRRVAFCLARGEIWLFTPAGNRLTEHSIISDFPQRPVSAIVSGHWSVSPDGKFVGFQDFFHSYFLNMELFWEEND